MSRYDRAADASRLEASIDLDEFRLIQLLLPLVSMRRSALSLIAATVPSAGVSVWAWRFYWTLSEEATALA